MRRIASTSNDGEPQKASFTKLAIEWANKGEIQDNQRDEILYMLKNADFGDWQPLLYVIPRPPVEARLQVVPIDRRASFEEEYIIENLAGSEFDILEW